MSLIASIKRWFKAQSDKRRFLRCHRAYGHEPFHMNDDGTWTCECGCYKGTWLGYSINTGTSDPSERQEPKEPANGR